MVDQLEQFRQEFEKPSGMTIEQTDGIVRLVYDDWSVDIEEVQVAKGEVQLQVRPVGGYERFDVSPEAAARYIEDQLL
jgi:hypothetical protein